MSDSSIAREHIRELGRFWWVPAALGGLSLLVGVIVLIKPSNSLGTLAVIAGLFVLFDGIAQLVSSLSRYTENRGLTALLGVLNLVIGILLIRHPIAGVTAVALFIGIWLVVAGTLRLVLAFEIDDGRRGWHMIVAVVEVIAGVVIVASPGIGFATLALLVGFAFIVNGASMLLLGLAMRTAAREAARPRRRPTAAR